MKRTPFDTIYSHHPSDGGSPLDAHLYSVGSLVRNYVYSTKRAPEGTRIETISMVSGLCHDLGKATTWFQSHLDGQYAPRLKSQHSPLGALAAYHCLRSRGASYEDAFVGLVAVSKHHGTLPDVTAYINQNIIKSDERREVLSEQINDINNRTNARSIVDDVLDSASDGAVSWEHFRKDITSGEIYEDLREHTMRGPALNHDACSPTFYEAVLSVWAALTKADKTDAASLPEEETPIHLCPGAVRTYIDTFDEANEGSLEKKLNSCREDAREAISSAVSQLPKDGGVGTITLPTGLGKTLSSLDGAVEYHARDRTRSGPIIYALPYTSIVDQTAEEVLKVYNLNTHNSDETDPIDPYGWALTIDHHLESTATRMQKGKNGTQPTKGQIDNKADTDQFADEELLLGTMWGSGAIVTTHVQLFESLVRPSNAQSLKLPNLQDAVIILDEPQALPLDWWPIARRVVHTLTDTYNATILSMSATQPHLFTTDKTFDDDIAFDAPELVDDPSRYFEAFHRTDYHIHHSVVRFLEEGTDAETLEHTDAADTVISSVCETSTSALAICNTIASARELSLLVSEKLASLGRKEVDIGDVFDEHLTEVDETSALAPDELLTAVNDARGAKGVVTLHLTARHRPKDRQIVLSTAEKLATAEVPFVFVSTQLVEAGVDVSFRRVFRDLAPMPSLVQAAGRCNRSFEWEQELGDVTVWRLESTEGKRRTPSQMIYARGDGYNLLDVTRTALKSVTENSGQPIADTEITEEGVETYYETLVRRRPGNYDFVRYINSGRFQTLREKAQYIEERDTVEVVVCRVDEDYELVDEYKECAESENPLDLRQVRARLSERAVSVPRREYEQASLDARVLATTSVDEPSLVAVSSDEGWFSSTFGAGR
jgi:CRISPR-associated endonuclease/helicase Cas3/CRISPR-associated endonuclease Cas3-HD